jgi:Tfp pilus assembly protein PilO
MASFAKFSVKHVQVDRQHLQIIIVVSLATAGVIFTIFAMQSMYMKARYQSKVISKRTSANKILEANVKKAKTIAVTFNAFDNQQEDILGGKEKNSKIVLDSLPSKYDFPALASSISNIATTNGLSIKQLSGTDNEVAAEQESASPKPIEMPFEVTVDGTYEKIQSFLDGMQKSIRPIKVQKVTLKGSEGDMSASITAVTYYQPAKVIKYNEVLVPNGKAVVKKAATLSKTTGSAAK